MHSRLATRGINKYAASAASGWRVEYPSQPRNNPAVIVYIGTYVN